MTAERTRGKTSSDSDYKEHDESDRSPAAGVGISERKKQQAAMLLAKCIVGNEPSPQGRMPDPFRNTIEADRQRRTSLSQHRSVDSSPSRQRPPSPADRVNANARKEADSRELFRLYAAASRVMSTNSSPAGQLFDITQLVSARLLSAGGRALSGLRTANWDQKRHNDMVKAMDTSEHHLGWISETSFVREALIRFPNDEKEFQDVVRSCSDALQWVQFQTDTEVVAGIHADRCGSSCDHLPESISELLPQRRGDSGSIDEASPDSPGTGLTEDQRIDRLKQKERARKLRHLFRDCDVHHEGVISSSVLLRLAQVCGTLGHRTTHVGQHKVCEQTQILPKVCVEHADGVREIVWSDEHYHQVIKELDDKCGGHITESPFVEVFVCYLPKTDYEFNAVLEQLDAAAKHVRNVEYATQLNQMNHTSFNHHTEREIEADDPNSNIKRGAGCAQRGCVSSCSVM